ncbi:hypothetical protein M0P65_03310 [Candidatus Gracilibacteria bacterium]|nr:hypothetical protein [Candidatus Gracilibacteria bacterium]
MNLNKNLREFDFSFGGIDANGELIRLHRVQTIVDSEILDGIKNKEQLMEFIKANIREVMNSDNEIKLELVGSPFYYEIHGAEKINIH